jgi:hypothetical protein
MKTQRTFQDALQDLHVEHVRFQHLSTTVQQCLLCVATRPRCESIVQTLKGNYLLPHANTCNKLGNRDPNSITYLNIYLPQQNTSHHYTITRVPTSTYHGAARNIQSTSTRCVLIMYPALNYGLFSGYLRITDGQCCFLGGGRYISKNKDLRKLYFKP